MSLPLTVRTRSGTFEADLDDSDVSNEIWLSLPKTVTVNMLGSMIFSDMPVESSVEGERVTELDVGDIAYWPSASAFCLFFGPTPLSGEDGKPVSPYPVVKIGKLRGEFSKLENSGDGTKMTLEKAL